MDVDSALATTAMDRGPEPRAGMKGVLGADVCILRLLKKTMSQNIM